MGKEAVVATTGVASADKTERDRSGSAAVKPKFKVLINTAWCKGCGICIAMCPKKILVEQGLDRKAFLTDPDLCIGCDMCAIHCPEFAIEVIRSEQ